MKSDLNKKMTTKAVILRKLLTKELIEGSFYEKSNVEKDLKGIISKSQLEFHLYSKQKHQEGLITKGIVKSDKGRLSLNLKRGRTIARMIEYLENEPEIGSRVRYLFRKAFLESFFSEYGDVLLNEWRLSTFLYERNEATAKLLKDGDPDIADIYKLELEKRIGKNLKGITWRNYSWDDTYRGKIYSKNKEIRGERERTDKVEKQLFELHDMPQESLPSPGELNKFFIERYTEIRKAEDNLNLLESQAEGMVKEGIEEIKNEVDKLDLMSVLIDFAKEVRVNVDTDFMLSYILGVLKIERLAKESAKEIEKHILIREGDTIPIRLKRIPDFVMAHRPNSEILSNLDSPDPEILRSFVEKVLLKAMSDSVIIDNSISRESPVLRLHEAYVSNFITERREEVTQLLSDFITPGKKHLTPEERYLREQERRKEGLTVRPITL